MKNIAQYSPQGFYELAGRLLPWFGTAALGFTCAGLYIVFFVAPTDASQGEVFRIAFVHLPAVWLSMFVYLVMLFWIAVRCVFETPVPWLMAKALAPTGALFAFLGLWTGAIWGKPTLGVWWVWDPRLTFQLSLFLLYVAYMSLNTALEHTGRAERLGAVVLLAGAINLPLVYLSIKWWNGPLAGVSTVAGPLLSTRVFAGMVLMGLALWMYSISAALLRVRCEILEREQKTDWVVSLFAPPLEAQRA